MDQKTIEALALMQALSEQIREITRHVDRSKQILASDSARLVPLEVGDSLRISSAQETGTYSALCLDQSERAEITKVLESYVARLEGILNGCSLKLSQGVKDLLAEGEKFRAQMRAQAEKLKSEGGKK